MVAPQVDGRRALCALAALLLAGVALRALVMASWWPVTLETVDSWPYAHYARGDLLASPQHPPGYSTLLAAVGVLTRSVPVFVLLQFAAGIGSALLLFAATRRLAGSAAVALAPAAVVLLGPDQVYLEHSIMSEAVFLLVVALALYSAARALADGSSMWWAAATGLLCGVATVIRTAGVLMIVPVAAAILLSGVAGRGRRALAATGATLAALGALATVQAVEKGRPQLAPSPGWHLYSHAAQYADCQRFDPPAGTEALCEDTPRHRRLGSDHYLWDLGSPGHTHFDTGDRPTLTPEETGARLHANLQRNDSELGAFARAAILAQPLDYVTTVARDLLRYLVPGVRRDVRNVGADLSPALDFARVSPPETTTVVHRGLIAFFDPFAVYHRRAGTELLARYQSVFRFGATALMLCLLLIVVGLAAAPARRSAIVLLGGSGLSMLVPPVVAGTYSGRYSVPAAGLVAGAAAVAILGLLERRRGTSGTAPP
ncbi:MAG: glycosyltransferase family 39 protein [Solirubrobacterales bacterium]|nr:glycosyltransferase family 39 protein [Solirubrobacterales bacterium]